MSQPREEVLGTGQPQDPLPSLDVTDPESIEAELEWNEVPQRLAQSKLYSAIGHRICRERQLRASLAENTRLREALIRAERKLRAYVGVCKGDKELTDTVLPMAKAALAPRKANQDKA
jgi:hypothetical protein